MASVKLPPKLRKALLFVALFAVVFVASAAVTIACVGFAPQMQIASRTKAPVGELATDLTYDELRNLGYDLYLPSDLDSPRARHLVLFLHGGALNTGSKEDGETWCSFFAANGYVTVSMDYSKQRRGLMATGADLGLIHDEVLACVEAVKRECSERGIELLSMATFGISGGGAIAMNYAYRAGEDSALPVAFCMQISGPGDFEPAEWQGYDWGQGAGTPAEFATVMTGYKVTDEMMASGEYRALIDAISPAALLGPDSVPTLVGYGAKDHCIPKYAQTALLEALERNGVPHDYLEFPNSNHAYYSDPDVLDAFLDEALAYCERYFE